MKRLTLILPVLALAAAVGVSAPSAAPMQTVAVKETNFKIRLARTPSAGKVRFVITNASGIDHDFRLRGGGLNLKSKRLEGGTKAVITATLKKGVRYQVWCGVGAHATAGMKTSFVAR